MAAKAEIVLVIVLLLLSIGLVACKNKLADNIVTGHVIRYPGQKTDLEKIKIAVFRLGSGEETEFYPVDKKLNFTIPLQEDGKYDISAIVENDEGFSTKSDRVKVKDGKIENNKKLELTFLYTIYN